MDKAIFVENVKKYCALRGVKPTTACRESGAGRSLLTNLDQNGSLPSVEKVQQLADYLGVTTSELLGEEKNYALFDITHQFPFQESLDDLYASLEGVGPLLALALRTHLEGTVYQENISTPISVWLYAQVRSLEPIELNPRVGPRPSVLTDLTAEELGLVAAYRAADDRAKSMVDLALEPWKKKSSAKEAM